MFCIRIYLCLVLFIPGLTYANSTIVIVGDSLSAAYGLKKGEGWVDLLNERLQSKNLPYTVINASISGDTTAGGRQRLPGLIKNLTPNIIILELGGNDGLRGLSLEVIKNNLDAMMTLTQSHDIPLILVGLRLPPNYGPSYTEGFSKMFVDLATTRNVPLVASLLTGLEDGLELFQPDGIHPTAKAQARMLDNVWPILAPILQNQDVTLSRK